MKIESEKRRMDVHHADLSGSRFDDGIVDGRVDGAHIDGIAPADLLAYWRAGHRAKGA